MADRPTRIQMRRTNGWRKPEGAVYVGRPSRWGNHYRVGDPDPVTGSPMDAAAVVFWFRADLDPLISASAPADRLLIRQELRGRDLACWCPIKLPDCSRCPCHADVLLEIANG